jgi:tRNA A-37 threonylcarbamoyl transferase component Bud32
MRPRSSVDRGPAAPEAVGDLLAAAGIVEPGDPLWAEPLSGGVSSDIWLVRDARDLRVVVKSPLATLRVEQEWNASLDRGEAEAAWLETVSRLVPGACPDVLAHDARSRLLALPYLDPASHRNWKQLLLDGVVDPAFAGRVGATVGVIHRRAALEPDLAERFANDDLFRELRIEPYFESLAPRHPDLVAQLADLVDEIMATHTTLTHGDVSPKNILVGPDGPVLLDAETARWGDPAFDVAFCLTHLLLKWLVRPDAGEALTASATALTDAYLDEVEPADRAALDGRIARIVPALMLARVDGRSPVEYLSDRSATTVRAFARDWIHDGPDSVLELIASWKDDLA